MGTRAFSRDGSQKSPKFNSYFHRLHNFWFVLLGSILLCTSWAVFIPTTIPHEHLGYVGTITKYVVENHHTFLKACFWLSIITHLMEGFYAVRLCKDKGITSITTQLQWFLQTCCLGGVSLFYLWFYIPQKRKQ